MYCRRSAFLIDVRKYVFVPFSIKSETWRVVMLDYSGAQSWTWGLGLAPHPGSLWVVGTDLWLFTEFGSSLLSTSLDLLFFFFSSLCHLLQFLDKFLALLFHFFCTSRVQYTGVFLTSLLMVFLVFSKQSCVQYRIINNSFPWDWI